MQASRRSAGVDVSPDLVECALGRHDLVRVQGKEGEKRALLRASEGDRPTVDDRFQRAQHAELDPHELILIVLWAGRAVVAEGQHC